MEREGKKPSDLSLFLSSLLGYRSLRIQHLSVYDRIEATRHMETFKVDFDDLMTYQAMRNLKVNQAVSFDRDLDRITGIKRLEPKHVKTSQ
jgi:predicted nucleic acid-binding protein